MKRLIAFGCWTLLALVFASQTYVYSTASGEGKAWSPIFLWTLADWYIWAALSPLILALARRFRVTCPTWRRALLVHTTAALLFALAHLALQSVVQITTGWARVGDGTFAATFAYLLAKKIHLDLLTYAAIVGMSHAALYYRRYHEREAQAHKLAARTHKLEAQLSQARLQSLQMQLHPHFLFNALNTLSELIHTDPRAADRMVARLGDLLRLSLDTQGAQEVTLEQELEFLDKYLEIERVRFHDRLTVRLDIDPRSLDAQVPNMILQPIVENAIRHGIAARPGAGRIEIKTERADGRLRVRVRDDGAGLPRGWQTEGLREGIGFGNTRRRLEQLYDGGHSFEVKEAQGGGVEVTLVVPYRAGERAGR